MGQIMINSVGYSFVMASGKEIVLTNEICID